MIGPVKTANLGSFQVMLGKDFNGEKSRKEKHVCIYDAQYHSL